MNNAEYWNRRAASYDEGAMGTYEDAYRKTAERSLPYCGPEDDMLEIACGTGIMTLALAPHVGHMTAIDISDEMIARLREKSGGDDGNISLMHTDVFDHSLDGKQFDIIAAFNVLLYMENIQEALSRINSLLKPGGTFLSATDCVGGSDTPDAREKRRRVESGELSFVGFYTPEELGKMIEDAGFSILETGNLHTDPPNQFFAAEKLK